MGLNALPPVFSADSLQNPTLMRKAYCDINNPDFPDNQDYGKMGMVAVTATEIQKDFGKWHDRSQRDPVEITKHGRTTSYWVPAELFNEMWKHYRKAVQAGELSDRELDLILNAKVMTDKPYTLDDIPEIPDSAKDADQTR